ncbi:MAG: hypothetical protein HOQ03_12380 [Thermoleophilia bacterium]|nr:hypothetical protein [Thermoleophilia bacterium]
MTPVAEREPERLSPGVARWLLAVAYLVFAALYAWQASKRVSPTIFSDEIEFTQISRGIAEHGTPSRLGEPSSLGSLYTYLVAPAWWLGPSSAWEAAKLIGVLVMTAALFPAYGLARLVASRPWAVAAAVGAVAAPPLAYAPYLLEEPLAYPVSTAALWAIAAMLIRPGLRRYALAGAICVVALLVRGQLGVLLVVYLAALGYLAWRRPAVARWRSGWTRGDWLGVVLLAIGALVVFSAAAGHRSEPWYVATGFQKHLVFDNAVWSVRSGLAVLPVVAAVAAFLSPELRATEAGRAFVFVGVAATIAFVTYAAVKGAYLAKTFSILVVERNVIYLVPLVLAAAAAVLDRRRLATPAALVTAAIAALLLVLNAELRLDQYPYFESPSLAIGAFANRNLSWDAAHVERALVAATLISLALLTARALVRSTNAALALAVVAACGVTTWALTTEIYAARGLNIFSERMHQISPKPVDWIDQATGGEPTLYLGQQMGKDQNPIWLLEFWNYSIDKIWSIDGTAPLPSLSPDLGGPDGRLSPDPEVGWVVTGNGVEVVGEQVGEPRNGMTLIKATQPVRFRNAQKGVYPDGWMSDRASFSQFAPEQGTSRGFAKVVVSRQGACGGGIPTAEVTIKIGPVAVVDKQPGFARVDDVIRRRLEPCGLQTVVVRATVPYHVEVAVSPTFVPDEISGGGDVRELGAQVGFAFEPLR